MRPSSPKVIYHGVKTGQAVRDSERGRPSTRDSNAASKGPSLLSGLLQNTETVGHAEGQLFTETNQMKSWAAKLLTLPLENILHGPTRAFSFFLTLKAKQNGFRRLEPTVNVQCFKEGDKFSGMLKKLYKARCRRGFVHEGLIPLVQPWRKEPRHCQPLCAVNRQHLSTLSNRSRHQPLLPALDL